jgi:hypothetical protein
MKNDLAYYSKDKVYDKKTKTKIQILSFFLIKIFFPVTMLKNFSTSMTTRTNKLECLSRASFRYCEEPTPSVRHLKDHLKRATLR